MKNITFSELFPILKEKVHGKRLAYLDNSATALKPRVVINKVVEFYEKHTSNIHRGDFYFAQINDRLFDETRSKVKKFLGAKSEKEILFTSGATASLNLLAHSLCQSLKEGDEIILSEMEHHANMVVWQILRDMKKLTLHYVPVLPTGDLDMEAYKKLLSPKTRVVSIVHTSHVLGTINPIKLMASLAHEVGAIFITDAAQAVLHHVIDVRDLDVDFLVFSSHKMCAPSGSGVLYGKKERLENLPVLFSGGGAIQNVTKEKTVFCDLPNRFEPGTPPIESILGLGAAVEFLLDIGYERISNKLQFLEKKIQEIIYPIKGVRVIGKKDHKAPIYSFSVEGVHPHDVGTILDSEGVCVRTGKHCAWPLLNSFHEPSLTRASFAFYNEEEDVVQLARALHKVHEIF